MNELKLSNSTNMDSTTNIDNSEEKLVRINYRSDFPLAIRLSNFSNFPDYNFELRATVDNEVKSYCVEKKDGVCKNCKIQGDLLIIFFNNHGLSTGRLKIEMILYIPDSNYADGFKQEYYSATTSILLVEGNSDPIDDTIPSTSNSSVPVASVQLTDLANAVKDIQDKIKELQAATNNGGNISSEVLAGKQDRIEDLDTIRSNSSMVAEKLSKEQADQFYQPKGHYLTEHQDISNLISESRADEKYQTKITDLDRIREKAGQVDEKLGKEEAKGLYQPKGEYLTSHQDISGLLSKSDASGLYQPKGEYYTKSEVDVKINNIPSATSSPSGQISGEFNPRGIWNKTNTTKIEAFVDNKGKFTRSANFNSYLIPAEGIDKITITGAGATDTVPCVFSCFNKFINPLTSTDVISISRAETAKTIPTNYILTSSDIPAGTKMVVVSSRVVDNFTEFDFSVEYDKLNTTSRYAQSLSDCDYMAPSSAVLAKDLLFINITDRLIQGNVTITASGWNVNQANPKRCYCMIELGSDITIHIPSGLRSYIGVQDKSGVYSFTPWTTGKYTTTKEGKYCFLLSKIDNTDLWITDLSNYPPFKLEVVGKSTLEVIMNSLKLHGIDVLSNKIDTETSGKDYSRFDKVIKGVNHRGWTGLGAAQDTLDAYKDSFTMGFRYVEVDVHKTSDDKFIIGHNDELPNRLVNPETGAKGSTVKIAEHTLEELKAFKDPKGGTVTELSEFCKLCKTYGLHPYIEMKKPFDEATMYKILDIITRSGLNYNFTIISFIEWTLESSIKYDDKIRVGLIYDKVQDTTIDDVVMRINKIKSKSTNRINVFLDANGQYFKTPSEAVMTKLLANKLPLEVWTMDTEADILALDPYVSGVTSNTVHAGKVLQDKR